MIVLRSIQSVNQVTVPLFPEGIRSSMDKASELSKEEEFFQRHIASSGYAVTAVALSAIASVAHVGLGTYHFLLNLVSFQPISAFIALGENLLFILQNLLFIAMATTAIVLGLFFPETIYPLFATAPDQTPYPDEAIAGECELPSPFREFDLGEVELQPKVDLANFDESDYFLKWRQQLVQEIEYERQKEGVPVKESEQSIVRQDVRDKISRWFERKLADEAYMARFRELFIKGFQQALFSRERGGKILALPRAHLLWEQHLSVDLLKEGGQTEKVLVRVGLTLPNGHPPRLVFDILDNHQDK